MERDIAQTAQWIGENATAALHGYEQGDYDTLKICLESVIAMAQDLGYVPADEEDPEEDKDLHGPSTDSAPEEFLAYWHPGGADGHWSSPHGCHDACPVCNGDEEAQ